MTKRSMVRAMCGVQVKDIRKSKGLMLGFECNSMSVGYGKQYLLVW